MSVMASEAIGIFLRAKAQSDLASLYNVGMEVQVNVAEDGGSLIKGETVAGRPWHGYSDGLTTWKSFRIPRNAKTNPENNDHAMTYDLPLHVEGIGMTGWCWQERVSKWVAYDFDSIANHTQGLSAEEMRDIQDKVSGVEWVTIRRSTSGSGLHLYVMLPDVPTENHDEHAALGRAILGYLSAITGTNLTASVDCCGGNMWVWHRKTGTGDGLTLIKSGRKMLGTEVPINWRDHLQVVTNKRRKNLPQVVEAAGVSDEFLDLCNQRPQQKITVEHQALIEWLRQQSAFWWWDADNNMLVTHTLWLKKAHEALLLRGVFATKSEGTNMDEQNCFCFPLRRGAWVVRRFTKGVQEADSWEQDSSGWTKCMFNAEPTVEQACRSSKGLEDEKGLFHFDYVTDALETSNKLGQTIDLKTIYHGRKAVIKPLKTAGKLAIEMPVESNDDRIEGWLKKDKGLCFKGQVWQKIVSLPYNSDSAVEDFDADDFDNSIRYLVTPEHHEYGWCQLLNNVWHHVPVSSIKLVLKSQGYGLKDTDQILGKCIQRGWTLVQKPFENEYPGNREWNLNAAQLRFSPTTDKDVDELSFPTWQKILDHAGSGLDAAVQADPWCQNNGVKTGGEYLKLWCVSLFKEPMQPLPYLFLYGDQNCGKSAFHESIGRLLTRGAIDASAAILSGSAFNKELEGSILCSIEEVNLNKSQQAYNRIKDWVTNRKILIHEKGQTPYQVPNTTHWVQCANDPEYCPVFRGDTRLVVIHVPPLEITDMIPRKELDVLLEKEAPDFLAMLMNTELPRSGDRLNLPVVNTLEKEQAAELRDSPVDDFIINDIERCPGCMTKFADLYGEFITKNPGEKMSKKAFSAALTKANYIKGKLPQSMDLMFGDLRLKTAPEYTKGGRCVVRGVYIYVEGANA